MKFNKFAISISILALTSGCAFQYYDADTQTDHIWGFGHMAMKAEPPSEDVKAVVKGSQIIGFSVGTRKEQQFLTFGYENAQRLEVVHPDTALRLEWPDSDLFKVRIGSEWPHDELE